MLDNAGDDVEDYEGITRMTWACRLKECPFPGCSQSAWNRARRHLWSVTSQDHVLSYLKSHGVQSELHCNKGAKDAPMTMEAMEDILGTVEIEETLETFEERAAYRVAVDNLESEKKHRKDLEAEWSWQESWQDSSRSRKKQKKDSWQESWQDDRVDSNWSWQENSQLKDVASDLQQLKQVVGTSLSIIAKGHSEASGSQLPLLSALGAGPSAGEIAAVPQFIHEAIVSAETLSDGSTLQAFQEKMVTVPMSKLILLKETVNRSKEACKHAMASMLTPLNQLRTELGVLANTEQAIDEIIAAAK